MAGKRRLQVLLTIERGQEPILIDEYLKISVKCDKTISQFQNQTTISIAGISAALRSRLLSQFTAFNKRRLEIANLAAEDMPWASVEVFAGYGEVLSRIYKGEVVLCDLSGNPPNLEINMTAFTAQQDKVKMVVQPPPKSSTLRDCVIWAANAMGLDYKLNVANPDVIVGNFARSSYTVSAILFELQGVFAPNINAFIDDDTLVVKDPYKILNPTDIPKVTEFIGIPTWFEWGVTFKSFFRPDLKLAGGCELTSVMNESLNGNYVIGKIAYEVTSRDEPFYVTVSAYPAAR